MASQVPSTPFKAPRPLRDLTNGTSAINLDSDTSTTEEYMSDNEMDPGIEALVRDEVQLWLASHGTKLFGLETSKFLANESKRKNIRSAR